LGGIISVKSPGASILGISRLLESLGILRNRNTQGMGIWGMWDDWVGFRKFELMRF
jgi:hypothetical protein